MAMPTKSLSGGFTMPVYGAGTWQMGGRTTRDEHSDDSVHVNALRHALKCGVTHFDTAEMYAAGHSERLLGEAIRGHDRSSLLLVSKASGGHHDAKSLRSALVGSLDRLGTDYLDVYMLHRYDSTVPIEETMGAMSDLIDEGLVRHPAVSNFTPDRFDAAQKASRHKIVANQVHYNVQVREAEKVGLLSHHQQNDVFLIAWRPVQVDPGFRSQPLMAELMKKYDCSFGQLAINWLIAQDNVVTVAKTSNIAHLEDNVGATSWSMEPSDVERVRHEIAGKAERSQAVPLDYD